MSRAPGDIRQRARTGEGAGAGASEGAGAQSRVQAGGRGTIAATALVALGGALGVVLRYAMSGWLEAALGSAGYSTLAINVLGAFALGLAVAYLGHDHRWFPLVGPGVLGGFTTYSSLAVSAVLLLGSGTFSYGAMLAYALGSLAAGLAAAVAGMWVGERGARG